MPIAAEAIQSVRAFTKKFATSGGKRSKEMAKTISTCLSYGNKIIRLSSDFIDKYATKDVKLIIEEDRNSFDYVYLTQDLIWLKGRKYDSKRNHINNFLKKIYRPPGGSIRIKGIESCFPVSSN